MKTVLEWLEGKYIKCPDCWIWIGAKNGKGYGSTWIGNKVALAHRAMFEVHNGPIPPGMLVCHRCDNPACINPEHLFLGTNSDNLQDSKRKGRQNLNRAKGSSASKAKLTENQVLYAYNSVLKGKTMVSIAKELAVQKQTIHAIARRNTWCHITKDLPNAP